jgi:hypothetical protein
MALAALDVRVRLLLSTPLLIEYEAVLTRPGNLARWRLRTDEILELLDERTGVGVAPREDDRLDAPDE